MNTDNKLELHIMVEYTSGIWDWERVYYMRLGEGYIRDWERVICCWERGI